MTFTLMHHFLSATLMSPISLTHSPNANSPIVHVGSDTCARLLTRFWYWLVYRLSDHMTDCVYDWCFGKYND